jgi:phage-related protein
MMQIFYYKKSSGKEPVKEFIESLPAHDRVRVLFDLSLIEQKGLKNSGITLRQIDRKLWEIKLRLSTGYRIFYCVVSSDMLCLLHAYKKQGQKAPEKEIAIAIRRMREVL